MTVHGTLNAYNNRACRCDECKQAAAEYHRFRRAIRRDAMNIPEEAHGKPHTYSNWMCRCGPCTKAHADKRRESYQAKRAKAAEQA